MHGLLDSDLDHGDDGRNGNGDREISLGTATVLGIFFLIALVCAGFFGFGYTLGRRSNQADAPPAAAVSNSGSHPSKPSAGGPPSRSAATPSAEVAETPPAETAAPAKATAPPAPDTTKVEAAATQPQVPKKGTASVADFLAEAQPAPSKAAKPAASIAAKPAADTSAKTAKSAPKPATQASAPVNAGGASGNFMVQIAAVSTQEIADIELEALKKKGYNVVARRVPQDNFLHIQIGPFASRKEAEQMRDRVSADGFNAIIKP
jgi:cytoskeletal protein RodZ